MITNKGEIRHEIARVKELLKTSTNAFTIKQNKKYLKKLKRRLYESNINKY